MARKSETNVRPKVDELRAMSVEDLRAALATQREELMYARFDHATAKLEKTSELVAMRRQVARIATILNEKTQRA